MEVMNEIELDLDRNSFLKLCKKVDLFGSLNDSKKRTITSSTVENFFNNNK
jgi:hypothetical protein